MSQGEPTKVEGSDRALPFHPFLFACFPVLSVYSANFAVIPLHDLWRPLGAAFGIAFAVWLILLGPFRNLRRSAVAASVVCVTTFLYSSITHVLGFLSETIVWGVVVLALAILAARLIRSTSFLNLAGTLLALMASGNIAWGRIKIAYDESKIAHSVQVASHVGNDPKPDIYYIILDGYGRSDMLKRVLHFDNDSFVTELKKRGFYVPARSHSNYVQTEISLSSSLNMGLIPTLLPNEAPSSKNRSPFDKLISNNGLAAFLRTQGYRTISITSGFPPVEFPDSDLWLKGASSLSLFETSLLQMTPFSEQTGATTSMYLWRRGAINDTFKNLKAMSFTSPRPRFFFAHVLAPHPPFVFGPNGEVVPHHGPYGYWDGSDFMTYIGTRETYRNGYTNQAKYLNGQVLETVDELLRNAKTPPIIVIQGDHGSKMLLDQDNLAKTDVTECFLNLEALYVPVAVRAKLYPGITPVNEFRVIVGELFGAKLPLLPDKSWYSPFSRPFELTDVTDRIEAATPPSSTGG